MSEEKEFESISKFLSLVLRHKPETIDLQLDESGWANVDGLIAKANAHGKKLNLELLEAVVYSNDKQRFAFSQDKKKIRASQGHSVQIDLELQPMQPPQILFHGTVSRFLESIRVEGLKPRQRQYVHLSVDVAVAENVGNRRGDAIVLSIEAERMHNDGYLFFLSENGVWLSKEVPAQYIKNFKNQI